MTDKTTSLQRMMDGQQCEFCDELEGGIKNSFRSLFSPLELKSRIIQETHRYAVTPGLGSLVPGYLLAWTKKHHQNMGQLDNEALAELEALLLRTKRLVQEAFACGTVLFEHGSLSRSHPPITCGSCIDHAHVHICPALRDLGIFENGIPLHWQRIDSLVELRDFVNRGKPYLFYEDLGGNRYASEVSSSLRSQHMRILWAKSMDIHDKWDWALFPMVDNILETIRVLDKSNRNT